MAEQQNTYNRTIKTSTGNVYEIRFISLGTMLRKGMVPNHLTKTAHKAVNAGIGGNHSEKETDELFELIDWLCIKGSVSPKLYDGGADEETNELGERNVVYVPESDKLAIYESMAGGSAQYEQFRSE